jgi:hypothetical protein
MNAKTLSHPVLQAYTFLYILAFAGWECGKRLNSVENSNM